MILEIEMSIQVTEQKIVCINEVDETVKFGFVILNYMQTDMTIKSVDNIVKTFSGGGVENYSSR